MSEGPVPSKSVRVRVGLTRFALSPGPVSLVTFIVYSVYSITRQTQFITGGYDLGIFTTAVRAYAHLQAPIVELKGMGFNLLGDHFHPILAVLAPLWWVWPSSDMLLVAQAGLVALSVLPVFWFVRRRMSVPAANAVTFAYAFSWMVQAMVDFDFHEIAFALPLIAFAIYFLDRGRYAWAVVMAGLMLLVREDMAFVVLMIALVLALRRQWKWAAVSALLAVVGYVVAMVIVIPHFSPTGTYGYWSLGQFGADPMSATATIVTHPWDAITTLVTPAAKVRTLLLLLAPFAFLSLGSTYALLALPIMVQRFLSDREVTWGTDFHYSAVLAPILVMSAVDALGRIVHRSKRRGLITALFATWCAAFVIVGTTVDPDLFPMRRMVDGEAFVVHQREIDLRAAVAMIPKGVCVEVDDRIAPALLDGRVVTLPGGTDGLATWLIVDLSQAQVGKDLPEPAIVLQMAHAQGFETYAQLGDIVVLDRPNAPVDGHCTP